MRFTIFYYFFSTSTNILLKLFLKILYFYNIVCHEKSISVNYVKSDVVLLIDLVNFTNPTGRLYNGQCCDSYLYEENCSQLPPRCDVGIKICIDSPDNIQNSSNANSCSYGSYILNGLRDLNTFEFKLNPQAAQPFIFTLDWNHNTLPRFLLKFFALDDSSDRRSITMNEKDKLIDYYVVDYNANQTITPTDGLSNTIDWMNYTTVMGRLSNGNFQTFLTLRVAMKCRTNYFTSTCKVRCVQQDSCDGGHYRCDDKTGAKICLPGFYDPDTDCVKRNFTIQLCEKSDAEYCSGKGFCYDDPFLPSNMTVPTCCCNRGFGGVDCSDIISCEINTCQNGGECLIYPSTQLGYCNCRLGFKGKYCEIAINCPLNYYGDDCATKCEAIDTCEIHQECDYYGRLKCKDGWGNFPECNVRLINPSIDPECPVVTPFTPNNYPPCLNGGSCWKGKCCCSPGYTGARCEQVVDQCQSSPCLNGATCKSTSNGFVCICPPSFSGIFCQAYIDPCRNSTLQCSSAGACIPYQNYTGFSCSCNEGYTGKFCEKQIDYCQSMPCVNNATCVPIFKGYYCNCPPRFSGINCERQLDLCQSRPCIHGMCYNLINDYFCNCDPGWSNTKTCNDDINECSVVPSICLNNSTCVNEIGSFKCTCPPNYTGQYCQDRIDYCSSNTCVMSQTLICQNDYVQNRFTCVCKPGFTGRSCELSIDYCASSPCIRDQFDRCVNYQSTYSCVCKPGFSGHNCEIDENECQSNPCVNNGICIDQINAFKCICPPGYTGPTCFINTNPCLYNQTTNLTVCGPYGTCYPQYFPNNTLSYYCQCIQGYEGRNCEGTKSICSMYSPCLNTGTCVDFYPNNFTCVCPSTHTGSFCENLLNPCLKGINLCNSGICVNTPGTTNFTCICPPDYTGQYCQSQINPCDMSKCVPNQSICESFTLQNGSRTYKCVCLSGFTGQYCQDFIDYCRPNPCVNNSTCTNMIGYYSCQCPANYYGNNCEYFYRCSAQPCSPLGAFQCIDLTPGINSTSDYRCTCRPGFTGRNCDVDINECLSSPCKNNGTCTDLTNSFICKCPQNFEGLYCEIPFDFCRINQCADGSTCIPTENGYRCLCAANKTGSFCTQTIDACNTLPCHNGGSCTNLITDYSCVCSPGYTNKNCSQIINQCAFNQCQNNGTCVNLINTFYCNCLPGFTGTHCQTQIDFCTSNSNLVICLNGGTCVSTPSGFRCECVNGYTGSRCDSNVDLCNSTICKNNGICRTTQDGLGVYCTCPSGFTGKYCESEINNCNSAPCLNNATCLNFPTNYACYCPFNYFGTRCENKLNFCQSSPCKNGGTCLDQLEGFKCVCSPGFSGDICQIRILACASFPCVYGLCVDLPDGSFECKCEQGYTGSRCTERIDICKTGINGQPVCFNNGTCFNRYDSNITNSFLCVCPNQFTGPRCETVKNACESFPCVHGNCTDLPSGNYKCTCPLGFTGQNCESDINECISLVCFNNATCINTPGSFECRCLNGFTGRYCELTIDNCFSSPCKNNGLCINENNSYRCVCFNGYTGPLCENIIDYCTSAPCQNQATCQSSPLKPNYFNCLCNPGFTGVLCEQLIDPCSSNPCKNNAYCINRSTYSSPNNYTCVCSPGFTGPRCETKIDPCQSGNRCLNGGTCVVSDLDQFKCICPSGFTGVNCEVKDSCLSFPCLNGGTCTLAYPYGYQCICPSKYTGPTCMEIISSCTPNPCLNSGTCMDRNGTFQCICPNGFTGQRCETSTTCNPACVNGRCVPNQDGTNKCECYPGFTGHTCDSDIIECTSSPCKNGGLCSEPFLNMYLCICPVGYTGINCEQLIHVCDSNPCLNGGSCLQTNPNVYLCQCPNGFTGRNCELTTNYCSSNPCKNNAACTNGINQYVCHCIPGTQGINCEFDTDECKSNPCQNAGICITPSLNKYECRCLQGYTGVNCESWIETCVSNPCKNGGQCIQNMANMYECRCPPGYTGKECQDIVDPCSYQKCTKNFTSLNFNVYVQPEMFNFDSYRECIFKSWAFVNPTLSLNSLNTILNFESAKPALEFTNNVLANKASSVFYSASLKDLTQNRVNVPTTQDYSRFCNGVVFGDVTLYSQYWDISICGKLSDSSSLNSVREALLTVWRQKYADINSVCNCLNVDIFQNLVQIFNTGSQDLTRVFYLVYTNSNRQIYEKGKIDALRIPTSAEISQALRDQKLQSCDTSPIPLTFSLTICGSINRHQESVLLNKIKQSWQIETINGGIGPQSQVRILLQSYEEFVSENSPFNPKLATRLNYQVSVNSKIIDQFTNLVFNYDMIRTNFFRANMADYTQCIPSYPSSNSFKIITPNRLCDSVIDRIQTSILDWYRTNYNVPSNVKVDVKIVKDGIEELIDDSSNFYYSLPIYVQIDSQYLTPSDSVYEKLKEFFKTIKLKDSVTAQDKFQVIDPKQVKLYRVVQAYKFYFNSKVNRKNINILTDLIKQSFDKFNLDGLNSQVSIKHQQDVILNKNQNSRKANRLIAVITNSQNEMYDSRFENTDNITNTLALLINNIDYLQTENNEKLILYDTNFVKDYDVIKYSDLFLIYIKNKYNEIVSSDLTKISSWLNEQWNLYFGTSVLIVNNDLYFDSGELVIGINYLVKNFYPECTDFSLNEKDIENSFKNNLKKELCDTTSEYLSPPTLLKPTKNYFVLEVIGKVDSAEQLYSRLIRTALINSWSKEYPEFKNVTIEDLTKKHDLRIGSIGTLTTRIMYTILFNGQQAPSYFYSPPSNDKIESELRSLGTDMRIYPEKNSISKSVLSSMYAQVYPMSPQLRFDIESKITNYYTNFNSNNKNSKILYSEFYSGENKQNLSRLYYTFYDNNQMKYQCELKTLYLQDMLSSPIDNLLDYPIKSRHIDFEYEKFSYNFTKMIEIIKKVWYQKNLNSYISVNTTRIDVRLAEYSFWTSIFKKQILRIAYFLTINDINVNDAYQNYLEPTLEDLSSYLANVSFYFPTKLYKSYVYGNPGSLDEGLISNSIDFAWQEANANQQRIIPVWNAKSSQLPPNILFFDYNDKYKNLSKVFYRVLFNNYADQNDLFNVIPSENTLKSKLEANKFRPCFLPTCQPIQLFDFFSKNNFTQSQISQLLNQISDAWVIQNIKETDPMFKQTIVNDFNTIIPYISPNDNSSLIYRNFYSLGFKKNNLNLDSSDFYDPTDEVYNSTIKTVFPRGDYTQYIPSNTSPLVIEPVDGLKWWMILIIVLACILFLFLLLLCLFAFCIRRRKKEKSKMEKYESLQTSTLTNQNISTDPGVLMRTSHLAPVNSNEQIIETRHSFRNLTDNYLYETSNLEVTNAGRRRSLSATGSCSNLGNYNSTPNATLDTGNIIINKYYQDIHHHHHTSTVRRSLSDLNEMVDVISIDVKYPYEYETRIN